LAFLHSKTSLFLASKKAKSFVFTRSLSLFPQNNIFFPFPAVFPRALGRSSRMLKNPSEVAEATHSDPALRERNLALETPI
jgi:hypothetical protein